jgi:glycosyltransferase involved in cell wall biosynthesis
VVPAGIDDPARPSGGNRYDRRVIEELGGLGGTVREHHAGDLEGLLAGLPDGATVVVDGLVASFLPAAVVAASERLRLVVLLHMPFAEADPVDATRHAERSTLAAAAGVVTTSAWARDWVVRQHGLERDKVGVAPPGVDPAPPTRPSADGRRLLCLAAVTRTKGQDVLLAALAELKDLDWRCTCAGALDLEPDFVAGLREVALRADVSARVELAGPLTGDRLDEVLAGADLLVSASRHEAYGMAVTEALARGIPVLATDVGGHGEAVGQLADGTRPGVLVPPDDPDRLATALRLWLTDVEHRDQLRAAASQRRDALGGWDDTARHLLAAVNRTTTLHVSPSTNHS